MKPTRRRLLQGLATTPAWAALVDRAAAVQPLRRHGTLQDVQHIVVLMQENRSFDHYFGALNGVRGFADPFPVPLPGGHTVWAQPRQQGDERLTPFRLDTTTQFALMRNAGCPHTWPDAQAAWDHGRMAAWTRHKKEHSMAHFAPDDLPLHVALANAFTLCDAYHCSFIGGTHPNRYYLNTGMVDPTGEGGGPAIYNDFGDFGKATDPTGYAWTTYAERLQAAGVSWQVYQEWPDNFGDNSLTDFRRFREAFHRPQPATAELLERAGAGGGLARLRSDVMAGRLPQVSWIVGTAEGSEHPWKSSPAQGAEYVAEVLAALSADPAVWASTVLLINYDENDGYYDHMPPPAAPSLDANGRMAGHSGVAAEAEYHQRLAVRHQKPAEQRWLGRPYGLGPRVPMFVVSPFSRGGHVCSQVFDHTSVIRLMEARFGVMEPNISPWRRAVCGDLTGTLDLAAHDAETPVKFLPPRDATLTLAARARALPEATRPATPAQAPAPVQAAGARPARALPYAAEAQWMDDGTAAGRLVLGLHNTGSAALVIHAYDRLRLRALPRRYTLQPGERVEDAWPAGATGAFDLWLLGPNGWHRHFRGGAGDADLRASVQVDPRGRWVEWTFTAAAGAAQQVPPNHQVVLRDMAYGGAERVISLPAGARHVERWPLPAHRWYDLVASNPAQPGWAVRAAGHAENGEPSITDPAMAGEAQLAWGEPAQPRRVPAT